MKANRHQRPHSSSIHNQPTRIRLILSSLVLLTAVALTAGIAGWRFIEVEAGAAAPPAAGVDCGCSKTGDFKNPAQGVKPTVLTNGNSPHNIFNVSSQVIDSTQQLVQVTVKRNTTGNPVVLSVQLRGDLAWGFYTLDAGDKRFAIHYTTADARGVMLYALDKIDPNTGQALMLRELSQHATSSVVRFSPTGKYLFFSSIVYLADVPTNQLQFIDATTGADVYNMELLPRSAPGTPDDTFGSAAWGWGSDTRDRTFAVESVTGQNQTRLAVLNLDARAAIIDELHGAISGYWKVSQCGDVLAVVEQNSTTTVDVALLSTLDGRYLATREDVTNFNFVLTTTVPSSTTPSRHRLKYSTTSPPPEDLASNAAAQTCPPPPPANDTFAKATAISGTSGNFSGGNQGATKEDGEPNHAGDAGGKSIWYSWTAPAGGYVKLTANSTSFKTLLAAYTGPAVGSLRELAAAGSSAVGTPSTVNFAVSQNDVIKIAIDGAGGAGGNVTLNWSFSQAASNDAFANAAAIPNTLATGTSSGSSQFASKEAGEPAHAGNAGGKSIWYTWTAPATGNVKFTTAATGFNTLLAVYTGSVVGSLREVASNNSGTPGSAVGFSVNAGDSYKIAIDGVGGTGGPVKLSWDFKKGPVNDFFSRAIVLDGAGATVSGTNQNATKEAGEPAHGGDPGSASVWYKYTAPADASLKIDAVAADPAEELDMLLAVYQGASVDQLTLVRGNDNAPDTSDSRVRLAVAAGQTYYIAVDSKRRVSDTGATLTQGGSFSLTCRVAQPPPPNDRFAGAEPVPSDATGFEGNNSGALDEEGEPAHSGQPAETSVWYRWTAPATGTSTVKVCAEAGYRLSVYTGQDVGHLECVGCREFALPESGMNRQDIEVTAGTTYYIAVDGGNNEGAFHVTLTPPDPFVTKFNPVRIPLPGDATGLIPRAFNDDDTVVGVSFHYDATQGVLTNAFIYEGGQTTEIGEWEPLGVNNLREVVGATLDGPDGPPHAVLWRDGQLTPLDFGTLVVHDSEAVAINDRRPHAQIVGTMGVNENGTYHKRAFLYEDGAVTNLGTLGGENSRATAVNNAGQVVGVADTADGQQHAFLWQDGSMTDLGPIPAGAPYSLAHGLSSTGSITGNGGEATPNPARSAFLRTPDGTVQILSGADCDGPTSGPGYGLAVNRNDLVVGATDDHYFSSHAFLAHSGVVFNLDALVNASSELPQDWGLTHAVAVNDRGRVLAYQGHEAFERASGYLLIPTREAPPAPTYALTGRVADASGLGIPGVTVSLDGTRSATTTTDSAGMYRFDELPANGSYGVTPTLDGSRFEPARQSVNNLREDLSLDDMVLAPAQPDPEPTPDPTPDPSPEPTPEATPEPTPTPVSVTTSGLLSAQLAGPRRPVRVG